MKNQMKYKFLFVVMLIAVILCAFTPAQEQQPTENQKVCACSPGWPSGWWHSYCGGQDGGWKLIEQGKTCHAE